jgi:hypothetical protein
MAINRAGAQPRRRGRGWRLAVMLLLSGTLGSLAPHAAFAAGNPDHASCLGATASSVPPGTKDDVALLITELATQEGTTHGALVSSFAQQTGLCVSLPPIPPHP